MTRRIQQKRVERSRAANYLRVGKGLMESGEALADLADEDDHYGNAVAIIAIHAVIAHADALCVAFAEVKSGSGDHRDAADVLREALGPAADAGRIRDMTRILGRKDQVSYAGQHFTVADAKRLLEATREFCTWAAQLYARRPA